MKKVKVVFLILFTLMIMVNGNVLATTATVTAETLNFRKEPSTDAEIIAKIDEGKKVEFISEEDDWYKVEYNGNTGYVNKKYVKIDEDAGKVKESEDAEEINDNKETETTEQNENEEKAENKDVVVENDTITLEKETIVRNLPAINGNKIGEFKENEKLSVITKTNHWIFVQNDEISGWIPYKLQSTVTETKEEEKEEEKIEEEQPKEEETKAEETTIDSKTMYVNSKSIYLRSKPTTESDAITSLIRNTDVEVIGEADGWYKVKHEGETGYIRKDLLSDNKVEEPEETSRSGANVTRTPEIGSSSSNPLAQEVIDYAYEYLGCPYVYGTAGPSTFDCSGFTSYVYKHFGYSLPRSSAAQASCGTEVTGELQTGDIVLFLDYQTMDKVGHVGIYIGDGMFIHASSGSGYCVKTSTLASGSYKTRYAGARRVL